MQHIVGYVPSLVHEEGPPVPVVECLCGDRIECHDFTSTCYACGELYNFAGQPLKPMDEWGEY